MVKAMCGVQLKDRKRSTNLMYILGISETIDQLAMANSDCWYGHMLRREDSHILRNALDFEVESQRKKRRSKEEKEAKEDMKKAGCLTKWFTAVP